MSSVGIHTPRTTPFPGSPSVAVIALLSLGDHRTSLQRALAPPGTLPGTPLSPASVFVSSAYLPPPSRKRGWPRAILSSMLTLWASLGWASCPRSTSEQVPLPVTLDHASGQLWTGPGSTGLPVLGCGQVAAVPWRSLLSRSSVWPQRVGQACP